MDTEGSILNRKEASHALWMSIFSGSFFGFSTGIISGIGDSLVRCDMFPSHPLSTETSSLQSAMKGLLTSSILVGGILGALLGVPLADTYGRKRAYQVMGAIGCLSIFMSLTDSFWLVTILRTVTGITVGGVSVLVPLYVTEVCPVETRGSMGTVFQIAICFSILLAQATNYVLDPDYSGDSIETMCVEKWKEKLQLSLATVPALLMLIHSFSSFPESTLWLAASSIQQPLQEPMLATSQQEDVELSSSSQIAYSWKDLFGTRRGLYWTFVGTGLAASAQLTGINAIIFYSPQVFKNAGLHNVLLFTIFAVGSWNFVSVFVSTYLVDKVGRWKLMKIALTGMTCSSAVLGAAYSFLGSSSAFFSVVVVSGIMGFVFFFEVGPGALFFLLAAEIFPAHVRPKGLVYTNVVCWIFNIAVSFSFPVVEVSIGPGPTFILFAVIGMSCLLFIAFFLPQPQQQTSQQDLLEDTSEV